MKVCELCGIEIATKDGDNRCTECEHKVHLKAKKKAQRKANDDAMRSLGLVKVRGALGGVYWE
jgi:DNA-directed RNA polymerase subunit RPC12/RpoP